MGNKKVKFLFKIHGMNQVGYEHLVWKQICLNTSISTFILAHLRKKEFQWYIHAILTLLQKIWKG